MEVHLFRLRGEGGRPGRSGGPAQVSTRLQLATEEGYINSESTRLGDKVVDMYRPNAQGGVDYVEDEPVRFEPTLDGAWSAAPDWKSIDIHYQEDKRPVHVEHLFEEKRVAEEVEEALEALRRVGLTQRHEELVQRLRASRQAFLFEVDPVGATEECWMMLDAIEAFLARSRDGVLFVAEEGFYDAALQPICMLDAG